jgi:hypothetical protein
MPDYRICTLNKRNHVTGVERMTCPTDDGALGRAAELANKDRAVEIWNVTRFVGRVAPYDRSDWRRYRRGGRVGSSLMWKLPKS